MELVPDQNHSFPKFTFMSTTVPQFNQEHLSQQAEMPAQETSFPDNITYGYLCKVLHNTQLTLAQSNVHVPSRGVIELQLKMKSDQLLYVPPCVKTSGLRQLLIHSHTTTCSIYWISCAFQTFPTIATLDFHFRTSSAQTLDPVLPN
jgi:hypothetical protein